MDSDEIQNVPRSANQRERTQYNAPWDASLIVMTVLFVGLFLAISIWNPTITQAVICWGIILICAFFGVFGYRISDNELRIQRLCWSTVVPLADVYSAEHQPDAMRGSVRTFGIGGVFGYIGFFKNRRLSKYKAYATHRKKTVAITKKNYELIIVTPGNPDEFVQSLQTAINACKD